MLNELKIQPGETLLLDVCFQPSPKSEPLQFAVSSEAVYFPARKVALLCGFSAMRSVPHAQVRSVAVRNICPRGAQALGFVMVCAGIILGGLGLGAPGAGSLGEVLGWALAWIAGGILIPWAAKKQPCLCVTLGSGAWRWNPASGLNKHSNQQVQDTLESILDTCRCVGLPVSYEAEPEVQRLV